MCAQAVNKDTKILIIDDDPSVRGFLEIFLKRKGYQDVQTAEDGSKGLEIIGLHEIKLVFLDMRLPGIDGLEVLRRIKSISSETSVIMMTGYPEEGVAKQAMQEGAYDYIIKPFNLEYLEVSMLSKMALMSM